MIAFASACESMRMALAILDIFSTWDCESSLTLSEADCYAWIGTYA